MLYVGRRPIPTHQVRLELKVLALLAIFLTPASAYADPGSGALIYQLMSAAFVGGLFYARRIWRFVFRRERKQ